MDLVLVREPSHGTGYGKWTCFNTTSTNSEELYQSGYKLHQARDRNEDTACLFRSHLTKNYESCFRTWGTFLNTFPAQRVEFLGRKLTNFELWRIAAAIENMCFCVELG